MLKTPWLDAYGAFRAALSELLAMGPGEFRERSQKAWQFGAAFSSDPAVVNQTRELFRSVLGRE